jgi:hypothetical protein
MKLTVQNLQQMMQYLRNVAEVDANDEIANAASSLAFRLESAGTSVFDMPMQFDAWTELDQAVARYAIDKRDVYVLRAGTKHAVDTRKEAA